MESAARIRWNEWEPGVFERARAERKLVFLDISARWCHWCHVLDRTSLADPRVIALLDASYLPVRVDTDRRPDINERYNQGGWPTTAVLLPDGRLLTGATYLPPEALADLLARCADFYRRGRERIERDFPETAPGGTGEEHGFEGPVGPRPEDLALVGHAVLAQYDPVHPGFFHEPKFLQAEILAFVRDAWVLGQDREMGDTLLRVLRTMSGSGVCDPVAGGFFRYATRRDWTAPHYEKLLGDNAAMLAVYASAFEGSGDPEFARTARGILGFLCRTLYDPDTGAFFASQDADEEYYRRPADERSRRAAPAVDRTIISEYNSRAASALVAAHGALGPGPCPGREGGTLLECAERLGRHLRRSLWSREDGQIRFRDAGTAETGHLADNVAAAVAYLDLWDATRSKTYLEFAGETLDWTVRHFYSAKAPGFLDRRPRRGDPPVLGRPLVPFAGNARAAAALLRYGREAARTDLLGVAEQVLQGLSARFDAREDLGAAYGSALLLRREGASGAACRPGEASCL